MKTLSARQIILARSVSWRSSTMGRRAFQRIGSPMWPGNSGPTSSGWGIKPGSPSRRRCGWCNSLRSCGACGCDGSWACLFQTIRFLTWLRVQSVRAGAGASRDDLRHLVLRASGRTRPQQLRRSGTPGTCRCVPPIRCKLSNHAPPRSCPPTMPGLPRVDDGRGDGARGRVRGEATRRRPGPGHRSVDRRVRDPPALYVQPFSQTQAGRCWWWKKGASCAQSATARSRPIGESATYVPGWGNHCCIGPRRHTYECESWQGRPWADRPP